MTVLRQFGIELETFNPAVEYRASGTNIQNAIIALGFPSKFQHSHLANEYDKWQIKPDGSLRGVPNGLEVVSRTLPGTQASIDEVTKVANWLNGNGYQVNTKTGYHIHIDAADMSSYEASCIALRYNHCRGEINSILPVSRRDTHWAPRLAGGALDKVENVVRSGNRRQNWISHNERYAAVNLQHIHKSLADRRIEFRQHSGTVDASKVIGWYKALCDFIAETLKIVREHGGASTAPATTTTSPILRRQRTTTGRTRSVVVGTAAPRIPQIDPGTDYDLFLGAILMRGVVTQQDARSFGWPETRLRVTAHWLRRNGAELVTTQRNGELAYVGANGATTRDAIFTAPAQIRQRVVASAPTVASVASAPASSSANRALLDKLATTPFTSGFSDESLAWFNTRRAAFARP